MLSRVTSRELAEWEAFFRLEPWGTEIEDHRFGVLTSTLAEINRDRKKRGKPYKPEDFFPPRDEIIEEDIEDNGARWASFIAPFKKQ